MTEQLTPTIFDSFNARSLSAEEVAATFVPPSDFWKLCQPCHSAVLGPRGSGKTSLLKMLQRRALVHWEHPKAREIQETVRFIGVFIPTDIVWDMQLQTIGKGYLEDRVREALTQTAITLHVLRSLVSALIDQCQVEEVFQKEIILNIDYKKEKTIVADLARLWRVNVSVFTFHELKHAISNRILEIAYFTADERIRTKEGRADRLRDQNLIYPDFLRLASSAIELINDITNVPSQKWAFCFDELELAPKSLQTSLIRYLRSTTESIFFKLSMCPYIKTAVELANSQKKPDEGADFNLIPLWHGEKKDGNSFSHELVSDLLLRAKMAETDPCLFFGDPVHAENAPKESYAPGGANYNEIIELRRKDPSFKDYMAKHNIDIRAMHTLSEGRRARFVRKPLPSVIHRNYFRRTQNPTGKQQIKRSRKVIQLYTGWDAIVAVCEGNPRLLKGIIFGILNSMERGKKLAPRLVQWHAIEEARHKFRSKLKTMKITQSGRDRGVLDLLDLLGEYFQQDLLGRKFKPEPSASFSLDKDSIKVYGDAVGAALNAGALVYLAGDKETMIMNDLEGKRFRLSYLLATQHQIPLRIGVQISLSSILSRNHDREQTLFRLGENDEF